MVAVKWSAERDQRLFLLVIDQLPKLDAAKLSAAWKAKYGKHNFRSLTQV